jgi:hypothetical protein
MSAARIVKETRKFTVTPGALTLHILTLLRHRPKRIKPEPDPEILRRVEEKLASINLSSVI